MMLPESFIVSVSLHSGEVAVDRPRSILPLLRFRNHPPMPCGSATADVLFVAADLSRDPLDVAIDCVAEAWIVLSFSVRGGDRVGSALADAARLMCAEHLDSWIIGDQVHEFLGGQREFLGQIFESLLGVAEVLDGLVPSRRLWNRVNGWDLGGPGLIDAEEGHEPRPVVRISSVRFRRFSEGGEVILVVSRAD